MVRFIFGYVLGRHREARTGCGVLLILVAVVVISAYYTIAGV